MLDLLLNEEQAMIAESVRDYLSAELPLDRLRPKAAPVDLAKVRAGMAELGWFGVGLPEEVGGSGLGLVEEVLIQRECGRYLASPSVLASVLGAHVAHAAGDAELAGRFVSGEAQAALAILLDAEETAPARRVYAFDWNAGDPLLVWNGEGMGLFAAEAFTDVEPHLGLDASATTHAGVLAFDRPQQWVPATQAPLAQRAEVLVAAALVGVAQQATDVTVEYAKVREQFGKPIGHFQAVKHRCADMGVRAELSWGHTALACLKVQAGSPDAALQAAAAKLNAANAAHENGRASIQMHGGMGYHAECDAHWFMKRAHLLDHVGGGVQQLARRVLAAPNPLW